MDLPFNIETNITIVALANFAMVTSISPGPNNLMLAASGVNFGFKKTMPHMLGVYLGFLLMVLLACLGLGKLFTYAPILQDILTYGGCAYLLYLAYRIATAAGIGKLESKAKPFTFLEAALFQWINPKAWMMGITFSSAFGLQTSNLFYDTITTVLVVSMFGWMTVAIWTIFGAGLRRWMKDEKHLRLFNYAMSLSLLATIPFMLMG